MAIDMRPKSNMHVQGSPYKKSLVPKSQSLLFNIFKRLHIFTKSVSHMMIIWNLL
jgi:hypothetical protein